MDELPYNLVAQPGDKERGVGPDAAGSGRLRRVRRRLAFTGPVPGAVTPEDEVAELDRRIAARRSDPMCLYTPPPVAVALDPRSMPYNLGDDPVRAAAYEFANYAYVMKHADEWIGEEDADYTFRSLVQASVMNQLYYAFVSVSANLGGVYLNEKHEGDALPTYLSVPRGLGNAGRCNSCSNSSKTCRGSTTSGSTRMWSRWCRWANIAATCSAT